VSLITVRRVLMIISCHRPLLVIAVHGFFAIHAAASGAVNARVMDGKGHANGLYVLFYYSGGFFAIAIGGYVCESVSWAAMIVPLVTMLLVPLAIGWWEQRQMR
jgi:MFS transporter, YNFM family, putative membrane transport protein